MASLPVSCEKYRTLSNNSCNSGKKIVSNFSLILRYFSEIRDSVLGIATGYRLDDRGFGVRVPVGARIFSSTLSTPFLGPTQPPIQGVPGPLSPGVKRPGREADHSLQNGTNINKTWICISTPPHAYMA
jgi:hypothetical protein